MTKHAPNLPRGVTTMRFARQEHNEHASTRCHTLPLFSRRLAVNLSRSETVGL